MATRIVIRMFIRTAIHTVTLMLIRIMILATIRIKIPKSLVLFMSLRIPLKAPVRVLI